MGTVTNIVQKYMKCITVALQQEQGSVKSSHQTIQNCLFVAYWWSSSLFLRHVVSYSSYSFCHFTQKTKNKNKKRFSFQSSTFSRSEIYNNATQTNFKCMGGIHIKGNTVEFYNIFFLCVCYNILSTFKLTDV